MTLDCDPVFLFRYYKQLLETVEDRLLSLQDKIEYSQSVREVCQQVSYHPHGNSLLLSQTFHQRNLYEYQQLEVTYKLFLSLLQAIRSCCLDPSKASKVPSYIERFNFLLIKEAVHRDPSRRIGANWGNNLDISGLWLTHIPPVKYLAGINGIFIDDDITDHPRFTKEQMQIRVKRLTTLRSLYAQNNVISRVDESFLAQLPQLHTLDLSLNVISSVALTNHPHLSYLNLSENDLETIPQGLDKLSSLKTLCLCNNYKLGAFQIEIYQSCIDTILMLLKVKAQTYQSAKLQKSKPA